MNGYKTYITLNDTKQVVLSDLPFQPGQRLEIIVLAEEESKAEIGTRMKKLFDETQSLPGVAEITEEDIAAEIGAYRRGE